MNVEELFDSQRFYLNWARHGLADYGVLQDEPALVISDADVLRLLVTAEVGIIDLHLSRSGPRSLSTYSSSGRLWLWPGVGSVEITTESHPPQPEFGRDQWWSVMSLTIPMIDLAARSDDDPRTRGISDFALAAARRSLLSPTAGRTATSSGSNRPLDMGRLNWPTEPTRGRSGSCALDSPSSRAGSGVLAQP